MTTDQLPTPDAPRRVTVTRGRHGWEVKEERDNVVVHSATYTDWHRVERAIGIHGAEPARFGDPHRSSTVDFE
jgi:hypothetical protein